MTFSEAFTALMEQNARIRRKGWETDHYLKVGQGGEILDCRLDCSELYLLPKQSDMKEKDWVVL